MLVGVHCYSLLSSSHIPASGFHHTWDTFTSEAEFSLLSVNGHMHANTQTGVPTLVLFESSNCSKYLIHSCKFSLERSTDVALGVFLSLDFVAGFIVMYNIILTALLLTGMGCMEAKCEISWTHLASSNLY